MDRLPSKINQKVGGYFYGIPVNPHPCAFGYSRKNSKHTGIDLYTNLNAKVHAVEDGIVVGIENFTGPSDNSPWWNDTKCILVKGASGVVCYGEVKVPHSLIIGQKVSRRMTIGFIERVIKDGHDHYEIEGWRPTMLHLELYPHDTIKASHGFEEHLLNDPTELILNSFGRPHDTIKVTYDKYKPI